MIQDSLSSNKPFSSIKNAILGYIGIHSPRSEQYSFDHQRQLFNVSDRNSKRTNIVQLIEKIRS
jgi:hypothetical protein